MVEWVITVVAVAIITLLCDVILPDGQTRKYIKTVLGVVVTFVIVQPIIGLFTNAHAMVFEDANAYSVQSQYVESVEERRDAQQAAYLKQTLSASGFHCVDITVSTQNRQLTVKLSDEYDIFHEKSVTETAGKFFPSYKIEIIWK